METQLDRHPPESVSQYLSTLHDVRGVMRWVWDNITTSESRKWVRKAIVYTFILILCGAAQPYIVSFVFKGLVDRSEDVVMYALGGFLICILIKKYFERAKDKSREWVIGLHWSRMNRRVMELFFEKSVAQHVVNGDKLSATFIEKAKGKILHLQQVLLFDGLPTVFNLVFSMIFLAIMSPLSGLIILIVILHYVAWSLFLSVRVMNVCKPLDKAFREIGNRSSERCENYDFIKSTAMDGFEIGDIHSRFEGVLFKDRKFWAWFFDKCMPRSTVNAIGLVSVMSWGAWNVWQGSWNIAVLYPLYAWASTVCDNIWRLGDIEFQVNWNLPTIQSAVKSLSMKPEFEIRENAPTIDSDQDLNISFHDVTHVYSERKNGSKPVLEAIPAITRISFDVKAGEKVALLGPSGVGKTTVMRLLLRHTDPVCGAVMVNGHNLKDINLDSFLSHVGYIPQSSVIFDGTIGMNLRYGIRADRRDEVSDDEIWEVMRMLKIDFGNRLTHGLETIVGESGIQLSGGQCQRVAIGRAVLARPRIMIVDEATSSLDSETEREVQAGLEQALSGGTSALVVAHRLNTVRTMCNKFVVLRPVNTLRPGESQIEAIAPTFESLYQISPTFRRLADAQGVKI